MAAETGFLIDEKLYEIPTIDTFTMDEAQVLYDYSGLGLEDFVDADSEDRKFKNPGLIRALMHVAYQRGNPDLKPGRVKTLIGEASIISAYEQLAASNVDEDDALPPAVTTGPDESSPTNSDDSSESSGSPSRDDSDAPVDPPAPTTDGSSPLSASTRPTLVA